MDSTLGSTLSAQDSERQRGSAWRRQPLLFRVFACARPLGTSARHSLAELNSVLLGRADSPGFERRTEDGKRILTVHVDDPRVSSQHARLTRALGRWTAQDLDSRNGTFVNGARVASAVLADGDVLEVGRTFFLFRDAAPMAPDDPADLETRPDEEAPGMTTLHAPMARELRALSRVAETLLSVLIQGETGTGKELVARALHASSGRPGAFVAVNCGALPDTLVESELFGYRRGAFSEAREDRPGLVRAADRGTLFLDEVGDMPLSSQPALLRVLQERQIVPVGATQPVAVDIRVCAASHRPLEKLVRDGILREDLFARLAGLSVRLPPLRERREDLGLLIGSLTRRLADEPAQVRFFPESARALLRYDWPLNVRELEKSLEAAIALSGGEAIAPAHLPEVVRAALEEKPLRGADEGRPAIQGLSAEDAQRREELTALLTQHGGNITAVARAMDKERVQVRRWLKRFGIDPASFR